MKAKGEIRLVENKNAGGTVFLLTAEQFLAMGGVFPGGDSFTMVKLKARDIIPGWPRGHSFTLKPAAYRENSGFLGVIEAVDSYSRECASQQQRALKDARDTLAGELYRCGYRFAEEK